MSQTKKRIKQKRCLAQCDGHRHDRGFTQRGVLQQRYTARVQRGRRLHPSGILSQEILPHPQSSGNRIARYAQFLAHVRDKLGERDGTIKALLQRQAADILGHSTSQITELYVCKEEYIKTVTSRCLNKIYSSIRSSD